MATNVSGDLWEPGTRIQVTAGANLAQATFVDMAGTIPLSAAVCTGGIVLVDTANTAVADVKLPIGVLRVYATGTVTAGLKVEILQGAKYANISGTSTSITVSGVQNIVSGYPVGLAITSGVAGDTVLVNMFANQSKSA